MTDPSMNALAAGALESISDVEERVLVAAMLGEVIDLSPELLARPKPTAVTGWKAPQRVRALVLRELLRARHPVTGDHIVLDPRGIKLRGALICGELDVDYVDTATPLELARCYIPDGLSAVSSRLRELALTRSLIGRVDLSFAHVEGEVNFRGSVLTNEAGPALLADGLMVGADLFLDDGFVALGTGDDGAVCLFGGHVSGSLSLNGAMLTNGAGSALIADGLMVGGSLFAEEGFSATGSGEHGAVSLSGSHVSRSLFFNGAVLTNGAGPALVADGLRVDGDLCLLDGFSAFGCGDRGSVHLLSARVGGLLFVADDVVPHLRSEGRAGWIVDEMTYRGIPNCGLTTWLKFLSQGTTDYRPQPYQQLAAAARSYGDDTGARTVQMAQRRDQLVRGNLTWPRRSWVQFTGWSVGFGYQPWRALYALALSIIVGLFLSVVVWSGAFHKTDTTTLPANATVNQIGPCSGAERAGLALDATLPLIKTGLASTCAPDNTALGNFWRLTSLFLQLASWASATLFIAGYTKIIRNP